MTDGVDLAFSFLERFVEGKLKSDPVFYVMVWEDQPERRTRSARLGQVLVDLD
jgi:hypothetical protein